MQRRLCEECGEGFDATRKTRRFCNPTCRARNWKAKNQPEPNRLAGEDILSCTEIAGPTVREGNSTIETWCGSGLDACRTIDKALDRAYSILVGRTLGNFKMRGVFSSAVQINGQSTVFVTVWGEGKMVP